MTAEPNGGNTAEDEDNEVVMMLKAIIAATILSTSGACHYAEYFTYMFIFHPQ